MQIVGRKMCDNTSDDYKTPAKDVSKLPNCCADCFCSFLSPVESADHSNDIFTSSEACVDILKINSATNERIDKSYWVCDYADDIYLYLREAELKRYKMGFRTQQYGHRPIVLSLLTMATEKLRLSRTTLHMAVYLIDCFMDNFTIRADKLNLTTFSCLMLAAKIEEAEVDMPKFSKLNQLIGSNYSLDDLRSVEHRLLTTLHFDLLRPTVATFSEYFANSCVTLEDYHTYIRNWHNGALTYQHTKLSSLQSGMPEFFANYKEMVSSMDKMLFSLVDMTLHCFNFFNVRPSLLTAACIAAVRQLQCVLPLWTPYLEEITKCTPALIAPYVEALVALYKLRVIAVSQMEPTSNSVTASTSVLCDSPDSGIVSDTKSGLSSAEDSADEDAQQQQQQQQQLYYCSEYTIPAKRRRLK